MVSRLDSANSKRLLVHVGIELIVQHAKFPVPTPQHRRVIAEKVDELITSVGRLSTVAETGQRLMVSRLDSANSKRLLVHVGIELIVQHAKFQVPPPQHRRVIAEKVDYLSTSVGRLSTVAETGQ